MENNKKHFMVPKDIFELGLNPSQFTVYLFLLKYANENETSVLPNVSIISKKCLISETLVKLTLAKLEERHLIEFKKETVSEDDAHILNFIDFLKVR